MCIVLHRLYGCAQFSKLIREQNENISEQILFKKNLRIVRHVARSEKRTFSSTLHQYKWFILIYKKNVSIDIAGY